MNECRYPTKRRYESEGEAVDGAQELRERVNGRGRRFIPLYPYRCPESDHWHLSSARQGRATCPLCGVADLPSWFDNQRQEWVIYAHGQCPIQSGVKAVANV